MIPKMKKLSVDFYFDVMSPYTYFAFQILNRYKSIWNLDINIRPFNLGAIMNASGNSPPATVPFRAAFMVNDLARTAKWFGIEKEFKGIPENFFADVGKSAIFLNRALCLIATDTTLNEDRKWKAVENAFKIIWENPNYRNGAEFIVKPAEVILADLLQNTGIKAQFGDNIAGEGKRILKENTDRALGLKAFGSPIIHFPNSSVDSEIFFGSDRFEQIAHVFGLPWYGPRTSSRL
jgi:glutathione S-transferase kappa 1